MGEVSLVDVSKRFTLRIDGELQTVRALERVSFTVRDGEVVALDRPVRLRQDHGAAHRHGARTASGGRVTVDGREVDGLRPRPRHGVPACRAAALAHRAART